MKFGDFELGKYRFKQEEIGSTLLASTFLVWYIALWVPRGNTTDMKEKWCFFLLTIAGIIFLWILFFISNRHTWKCYYLTRKKRAVMKAKVEHAKVYGTKASVYMSIRFRVLETGERYYWKESFSTFPSLPYLEISRYLDQLPEVDVLVNLENHRENYLLIEPAFDEFVRQSQKMFRILNVIWFLLFAGSFLYVLKAFYGILPI